MDRSVYINKIALFLPNCPISNEEMEDYIGLIGGIAIRNKQNTVVTIVLVDQETVTRLQLLLIALVGLQIVIVHIQQ